MLYRTPPRRRRHALAAVAASALASNALWAPLPASAQGNHDLQINLSANATTVQPGAQVTVTMTIRNNGPNASMAANVESSTPSGTTFASVSTSQGEVERAPQPNGTGPIEVALGALAVNSPQTVTLVLNVTAAPGATILVRGTVQPFSPSGDGNQTNNASTVMIDVLAPATADIGVLVIGESETAGADSLYTYTVEVENAPAPGGGARAARDAADGVLLNAHVPEGALFAAVALSQGTATTPPVRQTGNVACQLGRLEEGATATVAITLIVAAAPGASLTFSASAASGATDPNPGDNVATVTTPVVASPLADLSWEPPEPPSDEEPVPPPQRLTVSLRTQGASAATGATEPARRATLLGYNVYRSNTPGTAPTPGNLFTSVPPNQTTATGPAAPGGTFYVITAVYDEGESGPSNEGSAGVPAATLASVKVKAAKIVAVGTGFSDEVLVLVDGIPFVASAKVKKNNTKVVQKGTLLNGQTIGQYLSSHPNVLVGIRNSNGGVATYRHPQ